GGARTAMPSGDARACQPTGRPQPRELLASRRPWNDPFAQGPRPGSTHPGGAGGQSLSSLRRPRPEARLAHSGAPPIRVTDCGPLAADPCLTRPRTPRSLGRNVESRGTAIRGRLALHELTPLTPAKRDGGERLRCRTAPVALLAT